MSLGGGGGGSTSPLALVNGGKPKAAGKIRLSRTRAVPGKIAAIAVIMAIVVHVAAATGVVGKVAKRRNDDRGVIGRAFRADTCAFNRQNKRHIAGRPEFALAENFVRKQVGVAHGHDRFAIRVQQANVDEFDERIGAVADEFVEDGFEPLLKNRAAKPERAGDGAQSPGDLMRTTAQIRLGGFDDALMLHRLPRADEQPRVVAAVEQARDPAL